MCGEVMVFAMLKNKNTLCFEKPLLKDKVWDGG
jgi:hypothetical protein